jgi:hypothetical protein
MGRRVEPWKHMLIRDMLRRKCFTTSQTLTLSNVANILAGIFVYICACLVCTVKCKTSFTVSHSSFYPPAYCQG